MSAASSEVDNTPSNPELLEAIAVQIWTAQPDGRLDYVNQCMRDYCRLPVENLLGDGWQKVVHPADLTQALGHWNHALNSGEPYAAQYRILRGIDHQYRWHLARALPVRNAEGKTRLWVGSTVDIDEQVRSVEVRDAALELAQAERQRLYKILLDAPVAISFTRGPRHEITFMNQLSRQLLGGRNLVGMTAREALPEVEGQGLFEIVDQVYQTGVPFHGNEVHVQFDRDGDGELEEGYFNVTYQPIQEENQITGILSLSVEVTDQIRARKEIERLTVEHETILSQLTEGVIITDATGRITFANAEATRLHGQNLVGMTPDTYAATFQMLTATGTIPTVTDQPLSRAIASNMAVEGETWRIRRPDASEVLVEGTARPVQGADGVKKGAVLTLREMTK